MKINTVNRLQNLGVVPFSNALLRSLLNEYRRPNDKISEWMTDETLIAIKRGLYVNNPKKIGQALCLPLIANVIYGPSYVSLDYALSFYGLIPEAVYEVTSITTRRSKTYDTPMGRFTYAHSSLSTYPIGIISRSNEAGHYFLMAYPEKSLCDKLIQTSNLVINGVPSMLAYLEQDLRLDLDEFVKFDAVLLRRIAATSIKQRLLNTLCRTLEKMHGND